MSPTERSLKLLRKSGYLCAVVEKWNAHVCCRQDLWGFADILCCSPFREPHFLLVQTTTASNVAARLTKAKAAPGLRTWLLSGGAFTVHGWDGSRLARQVEVQPEDLRGVEIVPKRPRRGRKRPKELFE